MKKNIRILITGPIFDTPSGPSGQGGKLYTELKKEGYTVFKKSAYKNRVLRFADTLSFMLFRPTAYNIVLLQMFLLRAFIMEDLIVRICKILNKKCVAVIRGGAFVEYYKKHERWCNRVLSKIDVITTPSTFIAEFLLSRGFKVQQIPNFIDLSNFPYQWRDNAERKILWVRAFHDIYKPEMAIEAIAKLSKKYAEISLTMVGPDQGKLEYCKDFIKKLNIEKNIQITGPIPNSELGNVYASHQIFITTTSFESFGVALVEAAATGIPMVSTKVGEIPYMWQEDKEMLFVEDNNADALANAIERLLNDQKLRNELSVNARKKAEKYSWSQIAANWKNLLSD